MFVPDVVRTNLTVKLLVVMVLVWLVVAAVVTLGSLSFLDAASENRIDTISEQSALEGALVTSWVDARVSQTRLASQHTRVPSSREDMRAYLQSINDTESVYAVYYADLESSRVITSTDEDLEDEELRGIDTEWTGPLQAAAGADDNDFVAVSSRSLGQYDRPTLPFISRIGNTSRGLIVVGDATTLQRQLATGGDTRIVTSSGSPVFAPDSARINTSTEAFETAQDGIANGYTEGPRFVQLTPVNGTDWIAVTTAPYGTPMLGSTVANWSITLIALLVSLVGTSLLVGRSISHPLVRLAADIDRLGVEELTFDGWSYRDDEIGDAFAALRAKQRALTSEFDETERIRREIESSRQELKRQNARLDQFASTLSHDLRNPLAIARGHTELVEMKLDDVEYDEHLEKISDAHGRIDSIINDVLTLTREGESVQETESVELEAIAREAWDNVDSGAATFEVAESRTIEVDPSRLQRALENLFRNSIDHVGESVTVSVGLTRDGFFVQDDGPGIPDEMMDTVFEYGHTTSDEGTGLGLSIVKTIAEAHGWTVWVDGTYEDGARFVFSEVFENEQVPFTETEFTWAGSLRSGPNDGVR